MRARWLQSSQTRSYPLSLGPGLYPTPDLVSQAWYVALEGATAIGIATSVVTEAPLRVFELYDHLSSWREFEAEGGLWVREQSTK